MKLTPLAAALALMLLVPSLAAARDAFVGTWKVEVTPDEDARKAGHKEIKDTWIFKGMKLESSEFKKLGFPATQYEEDTRAGIVATFKCTAKSKTSGTAEWTGQSQAATISGELTWTKKDGKVMKFTFKGTKE